MNGKIEAKQMNVNYPYGDHELRGIWEKVSETNPKKEVCNIEQLMSSATRFLCIMTDSSLRTEVLTAINHLYSRGVRVYIVYNRLYDTDISICGKTTLMRVSPSVSGNMILVDPASNGKAGYFAKNQELISADGNWHRMDTDHIQEAYWLFCDLFWNKCTIEVADGTTANAPGAAPFDVYPRYDNGKMVYAENVEEKILKQLEEAEHSIAVYGDKPLNSGKLLDIVKKKAKAGVDTVIYFERSSVEAKAFAGLHEDGVRLVAVDKATGNFISTDEKATLMVCGFEEGRHGFGVMIQNGSEIENRIRTDSQSWEYRTEAKIRELKATHILFNVVGEAVEVVDESRISLPPMTTPTLRDLAEGSYDTSILLNNLLDVCAKQFIFDFVLLPEQRGEHAQRDPIYEEWQREIDRVKAYLDYLDGYAKGYIDEKTKSLSSAIANGLSKLFLGKNRQKEILGKQISELRGWAEGRIHSDYNQFIDEINDIYEKLRIDMSEIEEAIDRESKEQQWRKEKEDAEVNLKRAEERRDELQKQIEKAEENWQHECDMKNEKLALLEAQLSEKTNETMNTDEAIEEAAELQKVIGKLLRRVEEGRQELENVKSKQKDSKFNNILNSIKRDIEQITHSDYFEQTLKRLPGNRETKLIAIEKHIRDNMLMDLLEGDSPILEIKKMENEIERLKQDFDASTKKFEAVKDKNKRQLEEAEREAKRKQEQLELLGSTFVYQKTAKGENTDFLRAVMVNHSKQGRKDKQEAEKANCDKHVVAKFEKRPPATALPRIGVLYNDKGNRQLAITDWSDLDKGEQEAARLSARLVCER